MVPMVQLQIAEEQIIDALTQCRGDVDAAARLLKMPLNRLVVRVSQSESLTNIKRAFRAFAFDELSDFTLGAVRDGVVRQKAVDEYGQPMVGEILIPVDPTTRLAAAGKLMTILKSEAGISERTDHTIRSDGSEDVKAIAAALRLQYSEKSNMSDSGSAE